MTRSISEKTLQAWACAAHLSVAELKNLLLDSSRPWAVRQAELDSRGFHAAVPTLKNAATAIRRKNASLNGSSAEAESDAQADMLQALGLPQNADVRSLSAWATTSDGRKIGATVRPGSTIDHTALASLLAEPFKGYEPPAPSGTGAGADMLVAFADLQLGKAGERRGGTPELILRFRDVVSQLREQCKRDHPRRLVIADLGDICEGTSNHTSGSQTAANDLSQAEQLRICGRLLMEALVTLAPYAVHTTLACVRSNHAEERLADGKTNGRGDYGIMLGGIIKDAVELLGLDGVDVVTQDFLTPALPVEVGGVPVALTHGHYARRIDKMGDWVAQQAGGLEESPLTRARAVVYGHFHHLDVRESRGRLLVCCPAMESGSEWLRRATGEYSRAGVLTMRAVDGDIVSLSIVRPRVGMAERTEDPSLI